MNSFVPETHDLKVRKTGPLQGKITLVFLPRFDLSQCIVEYKKLQMSRKQWIETYANPPFYGIFYKGYPLNIFILPTVHTLPLKALPVLYS